MGGPTATGGGGRLEAGAQELHVQAGMEKAGTTGHAKAGKAVEFTDDGVTGAANDLAGAGGEAKGGGKGGQILHLLTEDLHPKGEASFKLLCDSSTVVDAINGDLPMDTEFLKPAFYRISRHLEEWSNGGIAFSGERLQPAEWRPRELNKVADALANEAMDRGESFERWHVNQKGLRGRHILVFTDGGVRPSRAQAAAAAAAWAVVALQDGEPKLVMEGAVVLVYHPRMSSFVAETIAIDSALSTVAALLPFEPCPLQLSRVHTVYRSAAREEVRRNLKQL